MKNGIYLVVLVLAIATNSFADDSCIESKEFGDAGKNREESGVPVDKIVMGSAIAVASASAVPQALHWAKEAKSIAPMFGGLPEYAKLAASWGRIAMYSSAGALVSAAYAGYQIGEGINYLDKKYLNNTIRDAGVSGIERLASISEKGEKFIQERFASEEGPSESAQVASSAR